MGKDLPFGNLVAVQRDGEVYDYLFDALGSTRALVDSVGVVAAEYQYGAWGEQKASSGPAADWNPYRFCGEKGYRYDATNAVYNIRAREYAATIARFLSRDPIKEANDEPNRYAYVKQRPTDAVDPSGEGDGALKGKGAFDPDEAFRAEVEKLRRRRGYRGIPVGPIRDFRLIVEGIHVYEVYEQDELIGATEYSVRTKRQIHPGPAGLEPDERTVLLKRQEYFGPEVRGYNEPKTSEEIERDRIQKRRAEQYRAAREKAIEAYAKAGNLKPTEDQINATAADISQAWERDIEIGEDIVLTLVIEGAIAGGAALRARRVARASAAGESVPVSPVAKSRVPVPADAPIVPKSAKEILDAIPGKSGKTGPIKHVPDKKALDDLFDTLGQGGQEINPGKYPGRVKKLPDGTVVRIRDWSSSTHDATIDVTMPDGTYVKVHIQP